MSFIYDVRDRLSGGALTRVRESERELQATNWHNDHLKYKVSVLEAERSFADGWQVVGAGISGDWSGLSDQARKSARRLARAMHLRNVWIKRGVSVQTDFVFGQGVTVSSQIDVVNLVVQAFWDDHSNQAELTTPDSLQDKERELQLHGELFFAFFTNSLTGRVQVRTFDPDSVVGDPICNPKDDKEPWYYKREYIESKLDLSTGQISTETVTVYHPDWRYNPASKPKTIGGAVVMWDAPIFHVKSGALKRSKRGVPEIYAQMDWGKVYTEFLSNRATVARALSEFTKKAKAATQKGADAIRGALASAKERLGVQKVGDTAITSPGTDIEAVNVKGATIDPKEGEAFLCAMAAGFNIPLTYFGIVDTGNLATAKSLDLPTQITFDRRRLFWVGVLTSILMYVLLQAATRPQGKLKGKCTVIWDAITPTINVTDAKGKIVAAKVDVDFPVYFSESPKDELAALESASRLIPDPEYIAMKAFQALKEKDVEARLSTLTFPDPAEAAAAAARTAPTAKTADPPTDKATSLAK